MDLWGFTEGLMLVKCLAQHLIVKKQLMRAIVESHYVPGTLLGSGPQGEYNTLIKCENEMN